MKKDNEVDIYQRDDRIWPWGYYIKGIGNFVTDSKKDAERQTNPRTVKKLREQIGA